MKLTKVQIDYFKQRIRIIAERVKEHIRKCYPVPESMSSAEKLELIASGAALLKLEEVAQKLAKDRYVFLLDAFEFPGECRREHTAQEARGDREKLQKSIDAYVEKLCDDFVLGRVDDPTTLLNDFEASGPGWIAGSMPLQ